MAKSTKNTYKSSNKRAYKRVEKMELGGNVAELGYSERTQYIEEKYAPFISDAQMIVSIYGSGLEYDYKSDRNEVVNKIIDFYKKNADYTEETLKQDTVYQIKDWDLVRREYDPETDEYYDDVELEMISSDNTYNFTYLGLVDLNWRVYFDAEFDKYFYVIMPHLGGDIRGNYGDAIILEGNDKEELFYRFYKSFISGGASIYMKFVDGSEVSFYSERDSYVFYFRVSDDSELNGMAKKYVADFEKFDSWKGDEFLQETVDIFLMRNSNTPKMMSGGMLNDENPKAYIQILGYNEGKWIDLSEFADGEDVMEYISNWMKQLNKEKGGNREEYAVHDYEGFGKSLYDEYMGKNEFDEIIEAYNEFEDSDFDSEVITAYMNEVGKSKDSLSETLQEMQNNYFGKYDSYSDFARSMIDEGVYIPTINDVYMTETTKRVLAGEEADANIDDLNFSEMLEKTEIAKYNFIEEKESLESQINSLEDDISDLKSLQNITDTEEEYERIYDLIESKQLELEEVQEKLDDIENVFEDEVRNEAYNNIYNDIYDQLDNNLSEWLENNGMDSEFEDNSLLSIDYDYIGDEISSDYLVIDVDGDLYFFRNYAKGGKVFASKIQPKHKYYIVENITKKLVSGYDTNEEAKEQRRLLIKEYPSMRFEIFTVGNLENKTDLDVYSKKDYVELSTLDRIKQVSVDAYRYGKEKVGQADEFLKRNDVKGRIKRGARKVWDKTKQGASWLQTQWREADFGDGTGRAKFFADGGGVSEWKKAVTIKRPTKAEAEKNIKLLKEYYGKSGRNFKVEKRDNGWVVSYEFNLSDKYADGGGVKLTRSDIEDKIQGLRLRIAKTKKEVSSYESTNRGKYNKLWQEKVVPLQKELDDLSELWGKSKYADGGAVDKVISTYYVEEDETGEKMKLIRQSVYSEEKLNQEIKRAKEKTFEYLDKGLYLFRNEVYVHPKKAQKPYLDKYKVSFETFSSGSEVKYKKRDKPPRQKEIYTIKNENGWVLGYRGSSSEMYFSPHTMPITFTSKKIAQEFIDRNATKNPFIQKGIIVKLFSNGGTAQLGEVSGMLPNPLPMSTITPMAKGGLTEHGLKVGDKIVFERLQDDSIEVKDSEGEKHIVDLETGTRFDNGGISYRSRDIDKIKVGDIVQYANSNTEYEAEVIEINYDSQYKALSSVTIKWLDNGKIEDAYLQDLMLSKGNKFADGGGVDDIKKGDEVVWKGNKYILSNIITSNKGGFYDTKYHLDSYKVGVSDAILDSLKGVEKVKYANGGGVEEDLKNQINQLKVLYNQIKNDEIPNESGISLSEISAEIEMLQYQLDHNKEYANGGGVGFEPITKPRPVTTPTKTPAPSKPDRNNPYKPKTTPKPKASKYDYIWVVE